MSCSRALKGASVCRCMAESKTTTKTSMPGFEVIVGGEPMPMMDGGLSFDGECTFQAGAECFRMLEECQQDTADLSDMVERLKRSNKDYSVSSLSSTASTVASSMASQWIQHMKRSFKRRAITLSDDQQDILRKMVSEHGTPEIAAKDIMMLYCRGLEAHHDGRYRECFDRIRPCMPFLNTNVLVWIRISESLIYEFYEEVWEFSDIYARLFDHCPRRYMPSKSRQNNELRPRHVDMDLRYAETATMMTFALARHSEKECVHFSASALHGFLSLKLKKWTVALEAVDFTLTKYTTEDDNFPEEMTILMAYKAEALIGQGRYNRAIEYCLRAKRRSSDSRTKHRALMLMAMAYIRKNNYQKAYDHVIEILNDTRLDEQMLENVCLLGLNLAHLMGNTPLFKRFMDMLQSIVY